MNKQEISVCLACSALIGVIVFVSVADKHKNYHLPHQSYDVTSTYNSPVSIGTAGTSTTTT